jgi:hypothetical protein
MRVRAYDKVMNVLGQEVSKELRTQMYACVFCDSVRKRLQMGGVQPELEALYLEHIQKYHGLNA